MKRIDICKACLHHEKDKDFGIICGLTYDKASFRGSCPDFLQDPEAVVSSNFQNKISEYDISESYSSGKGSVYKPGNNKNRILGKKIMGFGAITILAGIGLMSLTYFGGMEKNFGGLGIFLGISGIVLLGIGFAFFASGTNHFETEDDRYEEQEIE